MAPDRGMTGRLLARASARISAHVRAPRLPADQIIIGDNFSSLSQQAFGVRLATSREFITAAVTLFVILPMCFARSLSALGERACRSVGDPGLGWPGRGAPIPAANGSQHRATPPLTCECASSSRTPHPPPVAPACRARPLQNGSVRVLWWASSTQALPSSGEAQR